MKWPSIKFIFRIHACNFLVNIIYLPKREESRRREYINLNFRFNLSIHEIIKNKLRKIAGQIYFAKNKAPWKNIRVVS